MKCKTPWCAFESRHDGRCKRLTEPAINEHTAINRLVETLERVEKSDDAIRKDLGLPPADRTPNRRMRKAYNDYMREYMRKRRACPNP